MYNVELYSNHRIISSIEDLEGTTFTLHNRDNHVNNLVSCLTMNTQLLSLANACFTFILHHFHPP